MYFSRALSSGSVISDRAGASMFGCATEVCSTVGGASGDAATASGVAGCSGCGTISGSAGASACCSSTTCCAGDVSGVSCCTVAALSLAAVSMALDSGAGSGTGAIFTPLGPVVNWYTCPSSPVTCTPDSVCPVTVPATCPSLAVTITRSGSVAAFSFARCNGPAACDGGVPVTSTFSRDAFATTFAPSMVVPMPVCATDWPRLTTPSRNDSP